MGSGSTRRDSDIAAPKPIARKSSGGQQANRSNKVKEECPLVIKIKLSTDTKFSNKQKLILKTDGETVSVFAGLVTVVTVNTRTGHRLNECLQKGFVYSGVSSEGYAILKRTTRTTT